MRGFTQAVFPGASGWREWWEVEQALHVVVVPTRCGGIVKWSVAAVYCHYAKEDVMNASTLISFCQDAIHIVVMPAFVAAIVCKAVVYISFFNSRRVRTCFSSVREGCCFSSTRACIFLPLVYSDDGDVRRPLLPSPSPHLPRLCLSPPRVCMCALNFLASTM